MLGSFIFLVLYLILLDFLKCQQSESDIRLADCCFERLTGIEPFERLSQSNIRLAEFCFERLTGIESVENKKSLFDLSSALNSISVQSLN